MRRQRTTDADLAAIFCKTELIIHEDPGRSLSPKKDCSLITSDKIQFVSMRYAVIRVMLFLILVFAVSGTALVSAQQPAQQTVALEQAFETAPVIIDGTMLFSVRGISAFPAQERARGIAGRIEEIASDRTIPVDSVVTVETGVWTEIETGDRRIMVIVDADAAPEGVKRNELAFVYLQKVRAAIDAYRQFRTQEYLSKAVLNAFFSTLVFVIAVFFILKLFGKLQTFVEARFQEKIEDISVKSVRLIRRKDIWAAIREGLRILRIVMLFALAYGYLGRVLILFPWTRFYAKKLGQFFLNPLQVLAEGFVQELPNLLFLAVLFIITRIFLRMLHAFFRQIEQERVTIRGFYPEWAEPTDRLITVLVTVFAVVVAFPYIPGSESGAFKGISIFIGVLFSLGSQSAVANIVAGFVVNYRRAFKVGDRIQINEIIGDVTQIRMQVTHIRTIKNEEVIVPNSTILNSNIVNYSTYARQNGLIVHTQVTIGYDAPWRQVHALLLMAAGRTPQLLKEPPPFVLQKSLDDFYVTYELNAYLDKPQIMAQAYSILHTNIQDCFNEHGVQIMSPNYVADRPVPAIVPKEKWYAPPAKPPTGEAPENQA